MQSESFQSISPDGYPVVDINWAIDKCFTLCRLRHETGDPYVPILLGRPGSAKTAGVFALAQRLADHFGMEFVNSAHPEPGQFGFTKLEGANVSQEVMAGLPWAEIEKRVMIRCVDEKLPSRGSGVLFLDELTQEAWFQKHAAQLGFNGSIGDYYHLPSRNADEPGWFVVMAGNRAGDRAGSGRLMTHLTNRAFVMEVENLNIDAVLASWKQEPDPFVALHLKWFSSDVTSFDTKVPGPFATPRAWERANGLMHVGETPLTAYPLWVSCLGQKVTDSFRMTIRATESLPDLDDIIADPDAYMDEAREWGAAKPNMVVALMAVFIRRYADRRDVSEIDTALRLVHAARAEMAGAFVALAKRVDAAAKDGIDIRNTGAFAKYMVAEQALI